VINILNLSHFSLNIKFQIYIKYVSSIFYIYISNCVNLNIFFKTFLNLSEILHINIIVKSQKSKYITKRLIYIIYLVYNNFKYSFALKKI